MKTQTPFIVLCLLAVSDFTISASAVKAIPSGWRKLEVPQTSRVSIGGQEFYLARWKVDWDTAKQSCLDAGMRLLQINTSAKQSTVQSVMNLENVTGLVWIGLTDVAEEGRWRWGDNSLALYNKWGTWSSNENSNRLNCAFIVGIDNTERYKWEPDACWALREFICETY